jgi:hypothetical protein
MKEKLTDDLKKIVDDSRRWFKLTIEYGKLTVAEKFSILLSTLIVGAVCCLLGLIVLILLSFALVHIFSLVMPLALSYLVVAIIVLVLMSLVILMRRQLIEDPISKLITRLFFEKKG